MDFTVALGYFMLTRVTALMFKNAGMDNGKAAQDSSKLLLAYTIKHLFSRSWKSIATKNFSCRAPRS